MIDSILIYQHNTTRNYRAVRSSTEVFNTSMQVHIPSYSSPATAVEHVSSSNYTILTPNWILVDELTSDIYPELFL